MKCSISSNGKKNNGSCYTIDDIKIIVTKIMKKKWKSGVDWLPEIKKFMKHKHGCDKEICWDNYYPNLLGHRSRVVHLPDAGWNKRDRLVSNVDIEKVATQYEEFSKGKFKFVGEWDHDLDKKRDDFIHSLKISKGYKYRMILISLWGKRIQYAYHWICIFLYGNKIILHDSNADMRTLYELSEIIKLIKIHTNCDRLYYMNNPIQYDYEHCGILCIHVMHTLLTSRSHDKIKVFEKHVSSLRDIFNSLGRKEYYKYMLSLRDKYFN